MARLPGVQTGHGQGLEPVGRREPEDLAKECDVGLERTADRVRAPRYAFGMWLASSAATMASA